MLTLPPCFSLAGGSQRQTAVVALNLSPTPASFELRGVAAACPALPPDGATLTDALGLHAAEDGGPFTVTVRGGQATVALPAFGVRVLLS